MAFYDRMLDAFRGGSGAAEKRDVTPRRVGPTATAGVRGVQVTGGFLDEGELNKDLTGRKRYKTYSDLLANVSIVAASTRYFLNLIAKAKWKFEPAEADTDGRFADLAEQMLTEDPDTPWHRIVRRAAMYRFYGFSIQEWTARRGDDNILTFRDIEPRPQVTIWRWDVDDRGKVDGVVQQNPNTFEEIYLPRRKIVYMVDDTLSDTPDGLGIFRHLAQPGQRLKRFEQLEGFGFETDLRGVPIGRGPFTQLAKMEEEGEISKAERSKLERPLRDFIQKHIKTPSLGLLLDSMTYTSEDEAATPSNTPQWDIELLQGENTTQEQIADTINRVNHEMARIMGTEGLLLGGDKVGSLALSRDKSHNLFLVVDGTLLEIGQQFDRDLLDLAWMLNGWPEEMKPTMNHESVQFKDIEQIAAALRDMANAGAILDDDDPAIGEVRDLLGLSRPDPNVSTARAEDAALGTSNATPETDNAADLGAEADD